MHLARAVFLKLQAGACKKCLENELGCEHSRADGRGWMSSGCVALAALAALSQLLPVDALCSGAPLSFLPCPEEEEEEESLSQDFSWSE